MIDVDEGVRVDKVFREIREPSYAIMDHYRVEMLFRALPGSPKSQLQRYGVGK